MVSIRLASVCLLLAASAPLGAQTASGRIIFSAGYVYGVYQMDANGSNIFSILPTIFFSGCQHCSQGGSDYINEPTQARSSTRMAFLSTPDANGNRVFVMNGDGTQVQQLSFHNPTQYPRPDLAPAISPDGRRIAYIHEEAVVPAAVSASCAGDTYSDIAIVNGDGSGLHDNLLASVSFLSDVYCNIAGVSEVAWSPDGQKLAFRRSGGCSAGAEIGVVAADGSAYQHIDCDGSNPAATRGLDWSPDGTRIVALMAGGSAWNQYSAVSGALLNSIPTPAGLISQYAPIRYSPDSTQLAYSLFNLGGSSQVVQANFNIIDLQGNPVLTTNIDQQFGIVPDMLVFWWEAGPPIGLPASMTLAPDAIEVCPGASVQLSTATYNSSGTLLTRGWAQGQLSGVSGDGGSAALSSFGSVSFVPGRSAGVLSLQLFQDIGNSVSSNSVTVNAGPTCTCQTAGAAGLAVQRSGMRYVFGSQQFVQTLTVTNQTGAPVSGPIDIVLSNLSPQVTLINAGGTSGCASPGSPFVTAMPSGSLAAGSSIMVQLQFRDPLQTGFSYATTVTTGFGAP